MPTAELQEIDIHLASIKNNQRNVPKTTEHPILN